MSARVFAPVAAGPGFALPLLASDEGVREIRDYRAASSGTLEFTLVRLEEIAGEWYLVTRAPDHTHFVSARNLRAGGAP